MIVINYCQKTEIFQVFAFIEFKIEKGLIVIEL